MQSCDEKIITNLNRHKWIMIENFCWVKMLQTNLHIEEIDKIWKNLEYPSFWNNYTYKCKLSPWVFQNKWLLRWKLCTSEPENINYILPSLLDNIKTLEKWIYLSGLQKLEFELAWKNWPLTLKICMLLCNLYYMYYALSRFYFCFL